MFFQFQDSQYVEEPNFKEESSIRFPSEPDFKPDSDFKEELSIHFPSDSDFKDDFEFIIVRGMMTKPLAGNPTRPSPRHGRFTLALFKLLESELVRMAIYEFVITPIGRLGRTQVPLEDENMPGYGLKNNGSWFCG